MYMVRGNVVKVVRWFVNTVWYENVFSGEREWCLRGELVPTGFQR